MRIRMSVSALHVSLLSQKVKQLSRHGTLIAILSCQEQHAKQRSETRPGINRLADEENNERHPGGRSEDGIPAHGVLLQPVDDGLLSPISGALELRLRLTEMLSRDDSYSALK